LHAIICSFADSSVSDTLVQSSKANGVATSLAVAFPSANASGNLLLLAVGRWVSGTLGTITSVTDSQGNAWTLIGATTIQSPSGRGQSQAHLYKCASCVAGANTVTVATSSSQDLQLIALEYSSATINAEMVNSAGGVALSSVASGNLLADASLAFAMAFNQSDNAGLHSDFSGTGWKQRINQADSSSTTMAVFDQQLSSQSTIEQTVSVQVSSFGLHVIVAAKGQTTLSIMEFLIS
jgi:hypothetical protein